MSLLYEAGDLKLLQIVESAGAETSVESKRQAVGPNAETATRAWVGFKDARDVDIIRREIVES